MIYDLYVLSEFFPREQAFMLLCHASKYYPHEDIANAISAGYVVLSKRRCSHTSDNLFFYLTEKGKAFVENSNTFENFFEK